MEPPRTILLIEQNLDGTTGGSYRSMLYLVRRMDRSRFRPVTAFYREHDLLDEYRVASARTLLLSYPEPVNLVDRWREPRTGRPLPFVGAVRLAQRIVNFFHVSFRQMVAGIALLARERVDVLHLNNGVTVGNELLLAAKLLGRRCVIHQRGILPIPRWNARVARFVDHILCVSDAARDNLIAGGIAADKCTTVHNGIDPDEFLTKVRAEAPAVRSRLGIPQEAPLVGLVGMIREWKGQIVLLQAMTLLRPKYPELRCLIVGGVADQDARDQAYLARLHDFVREHRLESAVRLMDYQGNAGEILQTFDVMVHAATDPEPFSRVVLEGMTLGRAIVASRTGGTPEAIENGVTGMLVPPGDPAALAERIGFLLDRRDVREKLGEGARRRIRERFLIQSNVEATERVYDRILARG